MSYFIGMIVGGTVAMFLSGALVAWLLRKITGINHRLSCVLSISGMTFVGAWSITDDGGQAFFGNWFLYLICGAIALPILLQVPQRTKASVIPRETEAR